MTSRQESVSRIVFEEIFKAAKELNWMDMIALKQLWASGAASWPQVSTEMRTKFLNLGLSIAARLSQLPR